MSKTIYWKQRFLFVLNNLITTIYESKWEILKQKKGSGYSFSSVIFPQKTLFSSHPFVSA